MEKPKFPSDKVDKRENMQLGVGCLAIIAFAIICGVTGYWIHKLWFCG